LNRTLLLVSLGVLCAPAAAAAEAPQLGTHEVRVGGRTVRALCTSGPRRVLLLPDDGAPADSWRQVLERLAGAVGACAYDGTVEPAAAATPRGWFELMDEMRRTHAALGFRPGYVLVGQGIGGLYARLFATDRPREVGGLVLLDPAHEDMPEELRSGMPSAAWEQWMSRRGRPNAEGVRETDLAARARGGRLPDVPVTVVTATRRPDGGGWDARFLNQAARRLHASLLKGVTGARHVPAGRSGYDVRWDDPELVTREILRVARQSTEERR
jgi:pimeloyl-ACP methyl ester carboxylesterase